MSQSPIIKSIDRVQSWWQTRDWKQWIQQLVPQERLVPQEPRDEPGPDAEAAFGSVAGSQSNLREAHRASLSAERGPTNEDLERLERGSIPTLIDAPELGSDVSLELSAQEEEARGADAEEDLVVVETDIGHEMAKRMLHNATVDD